MNLGGVLTTYSEIFDKVDVIISSLPSLEAYQNVLENIKKYKTNNKKIIILDMNTISIDDKIHFQNELQKFEDRCFRHSCEWNRSPS